MIQIQRLGFSFGLNIRVFPSCEEPQALSISETVQSFVSAGTEAQTVIKQYTSNALWEKWLKCDLKKDDKRRTGQNETA